MNDSLWETAYNNTKLVIWELLTLEKVIFIDSKTLIPIFLKNSEALVTFLQSFY
jgi:alpha-N-acetylglucosamine transferase